MRLPGAIEFVGMEIDVRDVRMRDAEVADFPALAAIYNQSIMAGVATMDTKPVGPDYFDAFAGEDQALLVAVQDRRLIGWGVVKRYSDRPGYRVACETSLYLDETHTGRGIGARMLAALVERAGALGYRHLAAKITAANDGSVRFHERHGFERVGVQRRIGRLGDTWHDVVILQRLLDDSTAD